MSEISVLFIVGAELLHTTTFLEAQTNTVQRGLEF